MSDRTSCQAAGGLGLDGSFEGIVLAMFAALVTMLLVRTFTHHDWTEAGEQPDSLID
jgi:hypothetical protein